MKGFVGHSRSPYSFVPEPEAKQTLLENPYPTRFPDDTSNKRVSKVGPTKSLEVNLEFWTIGYPCKKSRSRKLDWEIIYTIRSKAPRAMKMPNYDRYRARVKCPDIFSARHDQ